MWRFTCQTNSQVTSASRTQTVATQYCKCALITVTAISILYSLSQSPRRQQHATDSVSKFSELVLQPEILASSRSARPQRAEFPAISQTFGHSLELNPMRLPDRTKRTKSDYQRLRKRSRNLLVEPSRKLYALRSSRQSEQSHSHPKHFMEDSNWNLQAQIRFIPGNRPPTRQSCAPHVLASTHVSAIVCMSKYSGKIIHSIYSPFVVFFFPPRGCCVPSSTQTLKLKECTSILRPIQLEEEPCTLMKCIFSDGRLSMQVIFQFTMYCFLCIMRKNELIYDPTTVLSSVLFWAARKSQRSWSYNANRTVSPQGIFDSLKKLINF